MTKRQKISTAFILLLSLGCTASENGEDNQAELVNPLPVSVGLVRQIDSYSQSQNFTGTIRARKRSDLAFELGGRIDEVLVDEGDEVQQGQVLARLDTRTLEANRLAAEAALNQAKALLDELTTGPRQQTIDSARATAESAKSQLDVAELNLRRRQNLHVQGAISDEEYDQALYGSKTAQSNYEAAKQRLDELVAGTRTEKIVAQNAAIAGAAASLNEIEVALAKSTLEAPFSGVVTQRYFDPGSIAPASRAIVKLVEQDRLEAWVGLPVAVASKINTGDQKVIVIEGESYETTALAKIGELGGTQTQTVVFDIQQRKEAPIVSGQVCTIEIKSNVKAEGYWVPIKSLSKGVRGLWSVFVVESSANGYVTAKSDVEIVNTQDERVLVRGTLRDGDRIIIDGVHRIAVGQLVAPIEVGESEMVSQ